MGHRARLADLPNPRLTGPRSQNKRLPTSPTVARPISATSRRCPGPTLTSAIKPGACSYASQRGLSSGCPFERLKRARDPARHGLPQRHDRAAVERAGPATSSSYDALTSPRAPGTTTEPLRDDVHGALVVCGPWLERSRRHSGCEGSYRRGSSKHWPVPMNLRTRSLYKEVNVSGSALKAAAGDGDGVRGRRQRARARDRRLALPRPGGTLSTRRGSVALKPALTSAWLQID